MLIIWDSEPLSRRKNVPAEILKENKLERRSAVAHQNAGHDPDEAEQI